MRGTDNVQANQTSMLCMHCTFSIGPVIVIEGHSSGRAAVKILIV